MPDHVGACWCGTARYATAFALFVVSGCSSGDAELLVVTREPARAVIASPVDPRTLRRTSSDVDASPRGRAITRYYATADSADSLDIAFQRERLALNRDARRLAGADRRAPEYARDYDRFMARVTVATRTREARDRARRRVIALRTELGANAPAQSSVASDPLRRWHTALDSAARARGQEVQRAALRDNHAAFALEPGVWWIFMEHDAGVPGRARRHEARRGAHDTLRLGS
jgi:hypothetical protein